MDSVFIPQLVLRAILPALAGDFHTFMQLALHQFFGWQLGHLNR